MGAKHMMGKPERRKNTLQAVCMHAEKPLGSTSQRGDNTTRETQESVSALNQHTVFLGANSWGAHLGPVQ